MTSESPDGFAVLPSRPRPKPVIGDARVTAHHELARGIRRLVLEEPGIAVSAEAGQFVMVTIPPSTGERVLLPRPMAIHRRHRAEGAFELIYNVVGRGTAALARVTPGESLLVTGPLGRGFDLPEHPVPVLAIGRGIGVCSIMGVVEDAAATGVPCTAVLSASTADRLIGIDDCLALGAMALAVTDDDGSSAVDSLRDSLTGRFDRHPPHLVVVCGSSRLTRLAVELTRRWQARLQVSLEAHMACGLGYCHGCAAPTASDTGVEGPLVCLDGPVFAHDAETVDAR